MPRGQAMRHHIQGLVLLIVMLLALWGVTRAAGPVLSEAWSGEDSALQAETAEVVDPEQEVVGPPPLTEEEILELQAALTEVGYDPGTIDGLLGAATRTAAELAISDRGLPDTTTDRELTNRLQAEAAGLDPDSTLPDLDWDAIAELIEAEARAEANALAAESQG